jgi:Fe2+ or Zn2+ uptake regulation protein
VADEGRLDAIEETLAVFRARGDRVTPARRLLVSCLFAEPGHRTAEQLAAEVQRRSPEIHLSTIYRNLDELERLGIVTHSHLGHGPTTYHLASGSHGHLVCELCGTLVEVDPEMFASLSAAALDIHGFEVHPHHFAVLGRCAACRSQSGEPATAG